MNPSPPEFKSNQYEFNDEQNRTFSQLADAMGVVATLMKILGLVFLIFFGLQLYHAIHAENAYGPSAGLGAGTLICLAIGFWTGTSAHSFRRIVETKNEDIWHLMNAMESLKNMYGMLSSMILLCLGLLLIGLSVVGFAIVNKAG